MRFATIEEALNDILEGRMVIVVDDEDRENEGDLTIAADKVTPEAINFMATYGRGLICLAMTGERLDALNIPVDGFRQQQHVAIRHGILRLDRSQTQRFDRNLRTRQGPDDSHRH